MIGKAGWVFHRVGVELLSDQPVVQAPAVPAEVCVVCQIDLFVGKLVQVEHQPGLPLQVDVFPAFARGYCPAGPVHAVPVARRDDRLQVGRIGQLGRFPLP